LFGVLATFEQGPDLSDQGGEADSGDARECLQKGRLGVGGKRVGDVGFQTGDLGVEQSDLRGRRRTIASRILGAMGFALAGAARSQRMSSAGLFPPR